MPGVPEHLGHEGEARARRWRVIAFAPVYDAPRTAQIEAISSSHWMVMPPTWGSFADSHSRMSDAGVIG